VGYASEGSAPEACGGATGFSPWGLYFLSLEEECEERGSLNIALEGGLYGKGFL